MKNKEVVIIGGGPAGLTAGIYLSRSKVDSVLIEKGVCGGQVLTTWKIENYPGFPDGIEGAVLSEKMRSQAENTGLELLSDEVLSLEKDDDGFLVKTYSEEILCKGVVIASGSKSKKLSIPGEDKFMGRGISYCAVCDAPFFKDKIVTVIGGGDTAIEESIYLTRFAKKVNVMHRREELRATPILQERAMNNDSIEFFLNCIPLEFQGENVIRSLLYRNKVDEKTYNLDCDGVFVLIGVLPNTDFLKNGSVQINRAESGHIVVDRDLKTNMPGIFACGDVIKKTLYQVSTAVGEGALAAFNMYNHLK